jgi:nickel transport protein
MKILLSFFILSSCLFAHKLYILADDDGKVLHVKSYFSKSATCNDCETQIFDKEGKILFSAKTDGKGEITFPFVKKEIDIVVTASMGHKNRISYESENEIISEDTNVTFKKILLALVLIAFFFLGLKSVKK